MGIDALVVIGGDSTQKLANGLDRFGVRAVGVPKTIDNDLYGSDRTIGFDTAVSVATEAIDRLHTTAASHGRVMVLEVMGRNAGWIALHAGLAGNADIILIPEIPFSMDAVAGKIADRDALGANSSVVVVAEGAMEQGRSPIYRSDTRALGGIADHVTTSLSRRMRKEIRPELLGHQQRSGVPTPSDRNLAIQCGATAVHAIAQGDFGKVVVARGNELDLIPMSQCAGRVNTVPPDHRLIRTARGMGISFGDEALAGRPEGHAA